MVAFGGGSTVEPTAGAGNTTPGEAVLVNATVAGSTNPGLYSVTIYNQSSVTATVQGSDLPAAATVAWQSPDGLGLPVIAYDPGSGGSLKITTQAYSTA